MNRFQKLMARVCGIRLRLVYTEFRPVSEEQALSALCVNENEPLWRTINQFLDVAEERWTSAAISEKGTKYDAGGAAAMREMKDYLAEQRERARTVKDFE